MPNDNPEQPALNPAAIPVGDMAKMLSMVGSWPISADMIQEDIDDGAPINADGTMNLVHYGAWLLQEMGHGN